MMDWNQVKEQMRNIGCFVTLCLAFLSIIGGTAYLFYDKHILFGITNLFLSGCAMPLLIKAFKRLIGK